MLWNIIFYLTTGIMLASALAALFARQAIYGALYLVTSMVAVAVLYFLLGAPFVSALQVLVYVGAIVVLLVFMMTMLHRPAPKSYVRRMRKGIGWPLLFLVVLFAEGVILFATQPEMQFAGIVSIDPKIVGEKLFGRYLFMVEATALLLLGALTAVLYLSRKVEES
jgi:NADH-quinone oxidoreductase subunit J